MKSAVFRVTSEEAVRTIRRTSSKENPPGQRVKVPNTKKDFFLNYYAKNYYTFFRSYNINWFAQFMQHINSVA